MGSPGAGEGQVSPRWREPSGDSKAGPACMKNAVCSIVPCSDVQPDRMEAFIDPRTRALLRGHKERPRWGQEVPRN